MSVPSTVVFANGDLNYVASLNQVITDINALYQAFLATTSGALFSGTSPTAITWATGSRSFVLNEASQRAWGVGSPVRVSDVAAPTTKFGDGSVTAYAHPNVTISLATINGASPSNSWAIALTGVSGVVPIASGGTGATTQGAAQTALGIGSAGLVATSTFATAAQGTTADAALARAGGTMTGAIAMGNKDITGTKVLAFNGEVNNTPVASAVTIDFSTGSIQKTTLNAATIAITISNLQIGWNHLRIIQDATGGRAVTFTGIVSTRWGGIASQPALNTAVAGESILSIFWDGANAAQSLMRVGTP